MTRYGRRAAGGQGAIGAITPLESPICNQCVVCTVPRHLGCPHHPRRGRYKNQGAVNQFLDSSMDLVANLFGATVGHSMLMRNVRSDQLVADVGQWANYFSGPDDPPPYTRDPRDAWGQYP